MNRCALLTQYSVLCLILLFPLAIYPQTISLDVRNQPLNSVLIGMREKYDIQISFNDYQLSQYYVSADTVVENTEEALKYLLADLPFILSRSGDVFIVSYSSRQVNVVRYLVAGQVRDKLSKESLPFSHIWFGSKWLETDFLGQFAFQTLDQPPYNLKVSYLGYYVLDTSVFSGSDIIIDLKPSSIPIEEIFVYGKKLENSIQSGRNTGEIKINHQIARFLPGNGDNSVFNLLRLQPGICAAGEMANDIIIWGSYEGQSRVLFDGFTLFSLKNFNENISTVNPFLAKDIRVLKGGYGPQFGERIGGIVNITGVEGARESPEVKISLNNLTLNGYLSVPVTKRSSFVMAFRQTYYDLYESSKLSLFSGTGRFITNTTREGVFNIYPNYLFGDLNLKLTGETEKGDNWHLSLFAGSDRFSYKAEDSTTVNYVFNSNDEKNTQKGSSLFYSKKWNRGSITRTTASFSGFNNNDHNIIQVTRLQSDRSIVNVNNSQNTDVNELDLRIDHYQPLSGNHAFEFGTGLIYDHVHFREDTSGVNIINDEKAIPILQGYITDLFHLNKYVTIKPGLRFNYPFHISKLYLQPRLAFTVNPVENFRINGSAGQYNQFMALSSVVDENGNYSYRWTICGDSRIPVLSSNHYVAGVSYSREDIEISVEGYLKNTDGLTRLVTTRSGINLSHGNSRTKGLDIFIKKGFNRNTFWASYSLSRTEEYFDYFYYRKYDRALHDQLHELKLASVINYKSLYFSGSWVYGSGFNIPSAFFYNIHQQKPYYRLDLSAVYRLSGKKTQFDAGLSLLNVFNTANIKYSNYTRIPLTGSGQVSIQGEAVPRTITLFINFAI